VEGIDSINFFAAAAKKFGMLKEVKHAVHIELPWQLRTTDSKGAVAVLTDALPQISTWFTDSD
jgi:hypothetical protein